jgi:hypothetical protein
MRGVPFPSPYAAYLRVYEPLAAFPETERQGWEAYASRAATSDLRLVAEHRAAMAGMVSVPPRPVPTEEPREAFVLEVEDTVHVCPVQARLRAWVALGRFREGLPDPVLHAFVPPGSLQRADADYEQWRHDEAGAALRILTATWSVPVHWFVPFGPADRVVDVSATHPTVVLRTRMSGARRRVARALRTVRTSLGEVVDVVDQLEELGRWLEEFHARSWVELDYAGLARRLGPRGVQDDTSVADVAGALGALADGDETGAADAYRAVVERWAAVAALERAN